VIREVEVRRLALQQRVDRSVALQEVVMTILLRRIATSPTGEALAFKGGTALRKMVFGEAERFSEDLDFACLVEDAERIYLDLHQLLSEEDPEDEVYVRESAFAIAGSGTLQARYTFESPIGDGAFDLDVTSARHPLLLDPAPRPMIEQPYFQHLGLALPPILTVHRIEMAVEKVAALHRRFENGNPKDAWDLWKWFAVSDAASAGLVASLWPARLWLDGDADGTQWRGPAWIDQLTPAVFNWDRLRALLPGGGLDETRILAELKSRLRPWIDLDTDGVLADAGGGRRRRRREALGSVEAVRAALQQD